MGFACLCEAHKCCQAHRTTLCVLQSTGSGPTFIHLETLTLAGGGYRPTSLEGLQPLRLSGFVRVPPGPQIIPLPGSMPQISWGGMLP